MLLHHLLADFEPKIIHWSDFLRLYTQIERKGGSSRERQSYELENRMLYVQEVLPRFV